MFEELVKLVKGRNEFAVEFETYEEACELLKFLEDNTGIVWMSGDKPSNYYWYFRTNDYYLVIGSRLSRREKWEGISDLKIHKFSELLREPPKCLKRL